MMTIRPVGRMLPHPRLGVSDVDRIRALFERCSAFFTLVEGRPPGAAAPEDLLTDLPPDSSLSDKYVLGVMAGDRLVGVFDIQLGYPNADTAFIGLFVLDPAERNQGQGADAYGRVEAWLSKVGIGQIHLGVQMNNPDGRRFWERQGFTFLRDAPLTDADDPTPTVHVLGKTL